MNAWYECHYNSQSVSDHLYKNRRAVLVETGNTETYAYTPPAYNDHNLSQPITGERKKTQPLRFDIPPPPHARLFLLYCNFSNRNRHGIMIIFNGQHFIGEKRQIDCDDIIRLSAYLSSFYSRAKLSMVSFYTRGPYLLVWGNDFNPYSKMKL